MFHVCLCLVITCWERAEYLGSLVYDVFFCFFTFPYGVPGQVWYLILSILDICLLLYFVIRNAFFHF